MSDLLSADSGGAHTPGTDNTSPETGPAAIDAFIARWRKASGSELANHQLFVTELTALLGLPPPDPASANNSENAYVFERRVDFQHPDGSTSTGRIDCYRRACFLLEAKQSGLAIQSTAWDAAMLKAHAQASHYARALPPEEGRPPFLVVTDVGRHIGVYVDFSRSGATYIPFPDALSHRIYLDDLHRPEIRERLRAIWLDPLSLDPSRRSARVTRAISSKLAQLAKSLELGGNGPERVASFLMRCLFTMFAEDVGLLPQESDQHSFSQLLKDMRADPEHLPHLLRQLWTDMNSGSAFSGVLRAPVPHFNGGLFAEPDALALTREQIDLLIDAAAADWKEVEPAIFGTLLERALDPVERHKLGAHYTPRAYVERLVLPTVIEPLRAEWANVQASAFRLDQDGKRDKAVEAVRAFHRRLCTVRVLDPACGSGNFLYVTLEHLKRLEGEVLEAQADLGFTQQGLELEGGTVSPEQMLGLETNPRAARIAETVLWIGYLQWHFRTYAKTPPREPLLKDAHNIDCRDAVLAWDDIQFETDEAGRPITRWDGRTTKPHPVTGEPVPDETARLPVERYVNPRSAEWPEAEFVVGNPPFIGAKYLRSALGDGYVEALWRTYPEVPESADYVMHWWHKAAELTRTGAVRRFGLITTNSLRQTFNRRVVAHHMAQKQPLSLAFAIPDHPWVDEADGAAVRIAMTVGQPGSEQGELRTVVAERAGGGEGMEVELATCEAVVFSDLTAGADVASAKVLAANLGISSPGVKLHGAGFVISRRQAFDLGLGRISGLEQHIRDYRNGRDITATSRDALVIDLFGLKAPEVRRRFPEVYQWIYERVKPERDENRRATYREKWWVFGEPRTELREALGGLSSYFSTVVTSKHRFFVINSATVLPDDALINFASSDLWMLGVLSSRTHSAWALRSGGTLEDRPRYIKTRCFETFPFPSRAPEAGEHLPGPDAERCRATNAKHATQDESPDQPVSTVAPSRASRETSSAGVGAAGQAPPLQTPPVELQPSIARLAEQIDAHRKRQQALHPDLTLTNAYNVLERLRRIAHLPGEPPLTPKERGVHDQGLVSVLGQLHDELDAAVLTAYGWADLIPALVGRPGGTTPYPDKPAEQAAAEEELLTRLVALNRERAAEEARGLVRWLRPEFQNPSGQGTEQAAAEMTVAITEPAAAAKQPWPKGLPEQFQAVRDVLADQPAPAGAEQIARQFKRAQTKKVAELLETLAALGQVQQPEPGRYAA